MKLQFNQINHSILPRVNNTRILKKGLMMALGLASAISACNCDKFEKSSQKSENILNKYDGNGNLIQKKSLDNDGNLIIETRVKVGKWNKQIQEANTENILYELAWYDYNHDGNLDRLETKYKYDKDGFVSEEKIYDNGNNNLLLTIKSYYNSDYDMINQEVIK